MLRFSLYFRDAKICKETLAKKFYEHLMKEFGEVCCHQEMRDLRNCADYLNLCYQLNKLDEKWEDFVPKRFTISSTSLFIHDVILSIPHCHR